MVPVVHKEGLYVELSLRDFGTIVFYTKFLAPQFSKGKLELKSNMTDIEGQHR
jgi:hypothetical protein